MWYQVESTQELFTGEAGRLLRSDAYFSSHKRVYRHRCALRKVRSVVDQKPQVVISHFLVFLRSISIDSELVDM